MKSLWASGQGDPVFMRRVNGWLTMFWLAMIPVSLETGWVKSVTYVSAPRSGHSYRETGQRGRQLASRSTRTSRPRHERNEDIAGDVVEQVIERTDIDRA